jgi:CubicO group peptidase (beta-lactamase class C family)
MQKQCKHLDSNGQERNEINFLFDFYICAIQSIMFFIISSFRTIMKALFLCLIIFAFLGTHTGKTFPVNGYIALPCASGSCKMASGLIYIIKQGKVLTNRSWGYADYLEKTLFTPTTQFYIGSLKKQFIAAAILKLMKEGKIELNSPICRYVKFNTHLPAKDPSWIETTTIHHLLTHISGVVDETTIPINKDNPEPYIDRIYINATTPPSPTLFVYSSAAYALLEIAIKNITGLPVSIYIQQHFLTPFNMKNTTFHGPNIPLEVRQKQCSKLCYPYVFLPQSLQVESAYNPLEFRYFGSFDMVSTAEDLCTWNSALHSGKIFNTDPKTTAFLLKLMRGLYTLDEDRDSYYGYGIKTHVRQGKTIYWHEGLVTGASVYLEYDPCTDTHVVILSNNSGLWFNTKTGSYALKEINSAKGFFE